MCEACLHWETADHGSFQQHGQTNPLSVSRETGGCPAQRAQSTCWRHNVSPGAYAVLVVYLQPQRNTQAREKTTEHAPHRFSHHVLMSNCFKWLAKLTGYNWCGDLPCLLILTFLELCLLTRREKMLGFQNNLLFAWAGQTLHVAIGLKTRGQFDISMACPCGHSQAYVAQHSTPKYQICSNLKWKMELPLVLWLGLRCVFL